MCRQSYYYFQSSVVAKGLQKTLTLTEHLKRIENNLILISFAVEPTEDDNGNDDQESDEDMANEEFEEKGKCWNRKQKKRLENVC